LVQKEVHLITIFYMNNGDNINLQNIYELQQRIAEYEDAAAYKNLFLLFFLPLKSFSYSILKSNESAEEVVSDVFVEIWARRKQLMEIENLKMYLYISVRNASLRQLQKIQKTKTLSLDDLDVTFATADLNAAEYIINKELVNKIESAIEQLPPQCKIIYKLAKEDKLKYKEIGELLSISVKTIDNQLATALKKIASVLNLPVKKLPTR
jgi:RNA polymerase sigma-70 factor (family 1)